MTDLRAAPVAGPVAAPLGPARADALGGTHAAPTAADVEKLLQRTYGPGHHWQVALRAPPPAPATDGAAHVPAWWRERRDEMLALAAEHTPLYVYDEATLDDALAQLTALENVDQCFYAMKANPHPAILQKVANAGLGIECVSEGEVAAVRAAVPGIDPQRILYTPNFASRAEIERVLAVEPERGGVRVTIDSTYALANWGDLFAGRDILLRLDPGEGRGHHEFVKTGGRHSKFGIDASDLDRAAELVKSAGARVIGLQAHAGSGVLDDASSWRRNGDFLAAVAERLFPDVRVLDVGGGLGVPEKPGQTALDLAAVDGALAGLRKAHPQYAVWMEPGRFVVARAGALLATATQLKEKGDSTYVGVDAGMTSLIRPALYGAHHEIVNLTRIDEKPTMRADVVGPICESGDVLGKQRLLAPTQEGDVMLVGNAGAYGRAMASSYNMREPPAEVFLPAR